MATAVTDGNSRLAELHQQYFKTRDPELRDELVRRYARLPQSMVVRLGDRIGDPDDLRQTAMIGLLKALERFDPDRGVAFTTYAWVTISGELKRFYRDTTWTLRVPRHLQERYLDVARIIDDLAMELGRSPTVQEIAHEAGLAVDDVAEAMELHYARRPSSIDAPTRPDSPMAEPVVVINPMNAAEDRLILRGLLQRLPPREQRIVWLRFACEMSQSEIAADVGVSQMQVSRLLARSLAALREFGAVA
jgi:RNA polymerase sigma-B factor